MAATCILCPTYRTDTDPRHPDRPPVCEGDRRRLGYDLADIARLHDILANPVPVEVNGRWYQANYQTLDHETGKMVQRWEARRAESLAAVGGAAPIRSRHNQPYVSGTHTPAAPVNLDEIDLTGPARRPNLTDEAWRHPHDQIGHLSVATVLSKIARAWRDALWPGQHLPPSTVGDLVDWLRAGATERWAGARIDDACDRYPHIATDAGELASLRRVLRAVTGESDPPPKRWLGLACGNCHNVSLIARTVGAEYAECGGCGAMYTDADLLRLATEHAPQATSV